MSKAFLIAICIIIIIALIIFPLIVSYNDQKNNKFIILDVNINGVSMLVTQRAEFASVIKNNPSGVRGLINEMLKKISELEKRIEILEEKL